MAWTGAEARQVAGLVTAWRPRLMSVDETMAATLVDDRWTRKQTLGHLIDSAINNYARFVVLKSGELSGFPGYNQEQWVDNGAYSSTPFSSLVDFWSHMNSRISTVLESAPPTSAAHFWIDKNLSFKFLVDEYVAHALRHMPEICP